MRLLYLYIERYRLFEDQEFNFDSEYRFSYSHGVLHRHDAAPLPRDFFRVDREVPCSIGSVSVVLGENGTGKSSLAAALDEIFSDPDTEEFKYICIYEDFELKIRYLTNLNKEAIVAPELSALFDDDADFSMPQLIYASPHFSINGTTFRGRLHEQPPSTTVDVSVTRWVHNAVNQKPENAKLGEILGWQLARAKRLELQHNVDFVAAFGQVAHHEDRVKLPMPSPNDVTVSINSDFAAATLNALAVERLKSPMSSHGQWLMRAIQSFKYAAIPDVVLQLISIWHADCVMSYVYHREYQGEFPYNERWVDFGLRLRKFIGEDELNKSWKSKTFQQQQAIRDEALELLESMFREFPNEEEHKRRKSILKKIEGKAFGGDSDLKMVESGEDPEPLGRVISLTFKVFDDNDRKLLYDLLGKFYTTSNGKYALDVEFGNLSSGEMSYLNLFSRLYHAFREESNDEAESREINSDVVVFLDEAETTLHPAWQRKLLYNLIWFMEHFSRGRKVHLLFATHSPMLLSDVPKSNVVILPSKEGASGDTRHGLDAFVNMGNTFGANIFDLYRDSFFLDQGTVGAFAQNKIDSLLKKIFQVVSARGLCKKGDLKLDEYDKAVVKLVGDERVQKYLEGWIKAIGE